MQAGFGPKAIIYDGTSYDGAGIDCGVDAAAWTEGAEQAWPGRSRSLRLA